MFLIEYRNKFNRRLYSVAILQLLRQEYDISYIDRSDVTRVWLCCGNSDLKKMQSHRLLHPAENQPYIQSVIVSCGVTGASTRRQSLLRAGGSANRHVCFIVARCAACCGVRHK